MADEINDKTIALAISAERITAHLLRDAMRSYLHSRDRRSHSKATVTSKGKHTMKDLKGQNAELSSIEVTEKNIKSFDRYARKYHVAYALKKDRQAEPPKYYVFFRAKDVDSMTAAFKEYSASVLRKKDKTPLKDVLRQKSVLAEALRKRSKVKHKRKEMER